MFLSIITDEFKVNDLRAALAVIAEHGLKWVDLRGRCFGKAFSALDKAELQKLKGLLDRFGLRVAVLESSLSKVHLPDSERVNQEEKKLEGIIQAADILDCRLVRSFFYWQPEAAQEGTLGQDQNQRARVLEMFAPLARRARDAGLTLAFENCGVTVDEVAAVLKELDHSDWGLAWDVPNDWDSDHHTLLDDHGGVAQRMKLSKVVHVKAKGMVGEAPAIPYDRILGQLKDSGYSGPVTIETHNSDSKVNSVDVSLNILEQLRACWP